MVKARQRLNPWIGQTERRRSVWRRLTPPQLFVASFAALVALVTLGIVADRSAAFDGILHWQGGYYQPHHAPAPEEAIRIIRDAGGVAVLAHPAARGRPVMRMGVLGDLVDAGLDGVEIWHRDNDERSRRQLLADAERLDLLVTGSSDYHGTGNPNLLGEHTTAPEVLASALGPDAVAIGAIEHALGRVRERALEIVPPVRDVA